MRRIAPLVLAVVATLVAGRAMARAALPARVDGRAQSVQLYLTQPALLTAAGQRNATISAARASEFHEVTRAPQARASKATPIIAAARSEGKCAPVNQA